MISVATIWSAITKIIDCGIIWYILYTLLKSIKNNVKMVLIFKGIFILLIIKVLSNVLQLNTVGVFLEYVISWGPIAIIIIFQPEIRNILEQVGRTQLLGKHKVLTVDEREKVVFELMTAVEHLKDEKIGALIVIERNMSLQEYIAPTTKLYADLTSQLLEAIFLPPNPLHDGGVIIQGNKVTCAGAVFKTSMNPNVNKKLGTRHRAALGVAEETDAIALVVSEETGRISIACDNYLHYNLTVEEFRTMLLDELKPKNTMFFDAEGVGGADDENL
jgi:diadenylate cyclase